ncbi:MAG: hypothetical protein A2365_01315 [Candidatus Nealsonbacteria bacterium RIFOXYB1_FULL_40_15]|uniref:Uncharacterized protein n=2 Tax=Candidatus Nealsoniibacteriota TaxID=1817911 RepID=A0A1G2ERF3_9BACT|nr:MAG: hypothetical protein A2365_01315 [Candidatus Nealsonbacteria bacterium RIFOXYB1_FULL_40_15]OGZ27858.1 MAG: hypothetical protein A2427_04045 [Candidatus Nealsonbacteria bacterium RIFOXYC1_FULL_40_7]
MLRRNPEERMQFGLLGLVALEPVGFTAKTGSVQHDLCKTCNTATGIKCRRCSFGIDQKSYVHYVYQKQKPLSRGFWILEFNALKLL